MWCSNGPGSPIPDPTPRPTNPPTGPTPQPTPSPASGEKCCSWTQCKECQPTSEWCLASKGNCEGPCNGMWCETGASSSATSGGANEAVAVSQDFVQILCPPVAVPRTGTFKVELLTTTSENRVIGVDIVPEGAYQTTSGGGFISIGPTGDSPKKFEIEIEIISPLEKPQNPESTHLLAAWSLSPAIWSEQPSQPWINSTVTEYVPVLVENTIRLSSLCSSEGNSGDGDTNDSSTVVALAVVFSLLGLALAIGAFELYTGFFRQSKTCSRFCCCCCPKGNDPLLNEPAAEKSNKHQSLSMSVD